jgi:hypothetical protein
MTLASSKIESSEFHFYEKSVDLHSCVLTNSGKISKAYCEKLPSYTAKQGCNAFKRP